MWWLLVVACGGSPSEAPHAHGPETHEQGAHEPAHEHAAAAHPPPADHMMQMAAVRDRLRRDLGAAYDQPVDLTSANPAAGEQLYAQHCASCHGATGKGDGPAAAGLPTPPSNLTDRFHARFYSDAGRVHVIEAGAPESGMPAYGAVLQRQGVLDVYAYIRPMRGEI